MAACLLAAVSLHLAAPAAADPFAVVVDREETRKICQVTGETDRATGLQTVNATESRFKFWGTDLGASFEHEGRLVFLFGDTHAATGLSRAKDRDVIAFSDDDDPEDCLRLDVVTDDDGGFRPLSVPGVDGGAFSVPTAGFSANGAMHVIMTTDSTPKSPMARSVLGTSTDGGRTFRAEYELSRTHFVNVAAAKVAAGEVAGLPVAASDPAVLLWGSGVYRQSDVRLAVLPAGRTGERDALRYFAGLDAAGAPRWSAREDEAAPLLEERCVGEVSVAWNAPLAKWLMVYNCGQPRSQILLRSADAPWGPWSPAQVLFDAAEDAGFCHFMHPGETLLRVDTRGGVCPALHDPHTPHVVGDPYAPSMIDKFARGAAGSNSDIYFLMSTWNPYNVVLMKARLRLRPASQLGQVGEAI